MRDCVVVFCADMVQIVDFKPLGPGKLSAVVDGEQSDFSYGRLSWNLTESPGTSATSTPLTHLVFRAEIEPGFWVPPVVGPWMVKKKLRELAVGITHNLEKVAGAPLP